MYLFRAMLTNQTVLSSHNRVKNTEIDYPSEVYSHVMKTYTLMKDKIIFSFTDDINIAKRILTEHPDIYGSIGVIDIDVDNKVIPKKDINAIYPIFEARHWVELVAIRNNIKDISITNLNYGCLKKSLSATLIPSRRGALSLAKKNREYAVICDNLHPKILSINDLEKQEYVNNVPKSITICSDKKLLKAISEKLIFEINKYNIQEARKKYLISDLTTLQREI